MTSRAPRAGAAVLLTLFLAGLLTAACGEDLSPTATPAPPLPTFTASATATVGPAQPSRTVAPSPTSTAPAEPSATAAVAPTATGATAQPTPPATPLSALLPELAALDTASVVRIRDDWAGLSPLAPIEAHYSLQRDGDAFRGRAEFSVGGFRDNPSRAEADIEIPAGVMDAALRTLAGAPVLEGAYQPRIEHTDDYPSRRIEIDVADGPLVFLTSSQGDGNVPWGVQYNGREFILPSALPSEVIETLDPYLARDVQENLIEHLRNSP